MKLLKSLTGESIRCVQPSIWKEEHELRYLDEAVGSLKFPNVFKRRAEAQSADGNWVFEERGIWKPRILVKTFEGTRCLTEFPYRTFRENEIRLSGWKKLRLKRNFWKGVYTLTTDMNQRILTAESEKGFKQNIRISIDAKAGRFAELPWLVFLVLFIYVSGKGKGAAAH